MKWYWIQKEVVLAIHDQQIAEHGGAAGVRDLDLIESALARPKNLVNYSTPDVFDLAGAYAYGLARNHGFIYNNKLLTDVVISLMRHRDKGNSAPIGLELICVQNGSVLQNL